MANFDRRIEAWYETKVVFLIAVFSPIVGIFLFVGNINTRMALIEQSISNINQNHEVHIQDILQELKDMKVADQTQQAQIIELQKQVLIILNKK